VANVAWTFAFLFVAEVMAFVVARWFTGGEPGSVAKRRAKTFAVVAGLYGVGGALLGACILIIPTDDPYAPCTTLRFWLVLSASVLVPMLGGTVLLHRHR
jgi:hypothetical protein